MDVEEYVYCVGDHDEDEAGTVGWDVRDETIAVPEPEDEVADDFEVAVPPGGAAAGAFALEEEQPGLEVEVEAAEGEERIVHVFLVGDHELCEFVISQDSFVVARENIS